MAGIPFGLVLQFTRLSNMHMRLAVADNYSLLLQVIQLQPLLCWSLL